MYSCVCCSWHRAAAMVKSCVVQQRNQIPWLVLSNDHTNNSSIVKLKEGEEESDRRSLFDLSNNISYNLSLPETLKKRCYGTGSEWILTVDLDREIQLFYPLTQPLLTLSSHHTLLYPPEYEESDGEELTEEDEEWLRNHTIEVESPWDDIEWFRNHYVRRTLVVQENDELSKLLKIQSGQRLLIY